MILDQRARRRQPVAGSVELVRDGAVAAITLRQPEIRNALNLTMAAQLQAICSEIDDDDSIGCVVIRGADGTFCSGADTSVWDTAFADPAHDRAYDEIDQMYASFVRVGELKPPTVAAIRGAAVGAGLNLALATDLRIVAADARLLAGFLKARVHPGGGFFSIASRTAGREATAALGLFSEEISGERAVEIGLAWQALPDGEVEDRALELAARAARDPLLARRAARSFRLETQGASLPWPSALELERGVQLWTFGRRARRRSEATALSESENESGHGGQKAGGAHV
jgi:enoyl-CoA hydratase